VWSIAPEKGCPGTDTYRSRGVERPTGGPKMKEAEVIKEIKEKTGEAPVETPAGAENNIGDMDERVKKITGYLQQYIDLLFLVNREIMKKRGYPYDDLPQRLDEPKYWQELIRWTKIFNDVVDATQSTESVSRTDVEEVLKKLWKTSFYLPKSYWLDYYALLSSVNYEVESKAQLPPWLRAISPGIEKSTRVIIKAEGNAIIFKVFHDNVYTHVHLFSFGSIELGPLIMATYLELDAWQRLLQGLSDVYVRLASKK